MTPACLYIVPTPIGHRGDLTYRAAALLKEVDIILAEDTRHSRSLCAFYHIDTPLLSLHQYNEAQRLGTILKRLLRGQRIALISDAGTPLISDPGDRLVRFVREQGFRVIPLPGPCAAITALSASGLPTDRFIFDGFLPKKTDARRRYLNTLVNEKRTLIFYESTHRILGSLEDMHCVFGNTRRLTLAKELTKSFETIYQNTLDKLLTWIKAEPGRQKGEFVLILEGNLNRALTENAAQATRTLSILLESLSLKEAVMLTARLTSVSRQSLYQLALSMKS